MKRETRFASASSRVVHNRRAPFAYNVHPEKSKGKRLEALDPVADRPRFSSLSLSLSRSVFAAGFLTFLMLFVFYYRNRTSNSSVAFPDPDPATSRRRSAPLLSDERLERTTRAPTAGVRTSAENNERIFLYVFAG